MAMLGIWIAQTSSLIPAPWGTPTNGSEHALATKYKLPESLRSESKGTMTYLHSGGK